MIIFCLHKSQTYDTEPNNNKDIIVKIVFTYMNNQRNYKYLTMNYSPLSLSATSTVFVSRKSKPNRSKRKKPKIDKKT